MIRREEWTKLRFGKKMRVEIRAQNESMSSGNEETSDWRDIGFELNWIEWWWCMINAIRYIWSWTDVSSKTQNFQEVSESDVNTKSEICESGVWANDEWFR